MIVVEIGLSLTLRLWLGVSKGILPVIWKFCSNVSFSWLSNYIPLSNWGESDHLQLLRISLELNIGFLLVLLDG